MNSPELTEAVRLLKEVRGWHADKNSPEYNGCESEPCFWCEQVEAFLVLVNESKNDEERERVKP